MISPHHAHYHLFRLTEMSKIFWAHTLLVVSMALVGVFVPIYLLKLGYSIQAVLCFLALMGLFSIPLQAVAAHAVVRFGAYRLMAVGIFFQILYFATLISLPHIPDVSDSIWPLMYASFIWALYRTSYWLGFHINFSRADHHKHAERDVGSIQALVVFSKGIAPAIGGVVAGFAGINWIYGVAIGLSLLAMLPLVRHHAKPYKFAPSVKRLDLRKLRPDVVASMSNGSTTVAETVVWPILVFMLVDTYQAVGILSSVVAIASILTALYVRGRTARRGERHFLKEGVYLSSASDVMRLIAQNAGHVFGINLFSGIGNSMYYTPYFSRYYTHASEESRIEYITLMETSHSIAWGAIFMTLLALSFVLPDKTVLLLGIAVGIPANFLIRKIR